MRTSLVLALLMLPYVVLEPAPFDFLIVLSFLLALASNKLAFGRNFWVLSLCYFGFTAIAILRAAIAMGEVRTEFFSYVVAEFVIWITVASIAARTNSEKDLTDFTNVYIWGAACSCIVILLLKFSVDPQFIYRDESHVRIRGFFKDPNVLGPFLVYPIVSILCSQRRFASLGGQTALWSMLAVLVLTYSRGAIVALLIGLVIAIPLKLFIARRSSAIWGLQQAILACAIISVLTVSFVFLGIISVPGQNDYFVQRASLQEYDSQRFEHLWIALSDVLKTPVGYGPGAFLEANGKVPHNLLLGKLSDVGWIPVSLIGFTLLFVLLRLGRRLRFVESAVPLLSVLVAHIVLSMVIYSHHWRHFAVLLGFGLAVAKMPKTKLLKRSCELT